MARSSLRLLATTLAAGFGVIAAGLPAAASDDTWTHAGPLAGRTDSPVFALAVSPADARQVLAGTAGGAIYRSGDGGAAWRPVKTGLGRGVAALAFDPGRPGGIVAGTRGDGVWRSADRGATWQRQPGTEGRTVRAFAFLPGGVSLAGSDRGVLSSRGSGAWAAAGLSQVRVSALAVCGDDCAGGAGTLVLAGGDATQGGEPLPLYGSADAGQTWAPVPGVAGPAGVVGGSSMVAALLAQPAGAGGSGRALLMGTDTGLFQSSDRGGSWQPVTGGGGLPATDVSALALSARHPERLYVASDGGGAEPGGLWVTSDGGPHFASLQPPQAEVTALAVSAADPPTLLVAGFRPADHLVAVWSYRDAGGQPHPAAAAPQAAATTPARAAALPEAARGWAALVTAPEAPYLVVGACALAVVLAALAAHLRSGRRL